MELIYQDSVACLEQGIELLEDLSSETFMFRSEATLGATVGEHFRHNIDHYDAFLSGRKEGRVDYDDRARDPRIETDPGFASSRMQSVVEKLTALPSSALDEDLLVKMDSGTEENPSSRSSVRRELQFLLSHSVHHYALIAIICRIRGVAAPPDFGVAPSTLKFRETVACAH